jgi:paraquat-inducible protein B
LIPSGAALLCVWFAYRDFVSTGPALTIRFENADGLDAADTPLKYRGVTVGEVKHIEVSKDDKYAQVTARMTGEARNLARAGSLFWIVRPEVSVASVTGLGTIVSGEYIAIRPGNGPATNLFTGVEKEPPAEEPQALQIRLLAPNLGSTQEGSPVFYRGIQVGEVLRGSLGDDSRTVIIEARIWQEYAPLVRPESKFWNAGGLDLHVGLFNGLQINSQSPKTIVSGGIQFATPPVFGPVASNETTFVLNDKPVDKWKDWTPAITLQLPVQENHTNDQAAYSPSGHLQVQ